MYSDLASKAFDSWAGIQELIYDRAQKVMEEAYAVNYPESFDNVFGIDYDPEEESIYIIGCYSYSNDIRIFRVGKDDFLDTLGWSVKMREYGEANGKTRSN